MTFAASDLRFDDFALNLLAKGANLHAPLKERVQRTNDRRPQAHKLTRVRARDFGNGTSFTKVGSPNLILRFQQTAFFDVFSAKVIAVKIRTFPTGGRFHFRRG